MARDAPIVAAGAVLWRGSSGDSGAGSDSGSDSGVEICVVHRPKYDDWSLPKGKVEPGEHVLAAAVREVAEETGARIALGRRLPDQHYPVNGRAKIVHYWAAQVGDLPPRAPDHEVDEVAFVALADAARHLTYQRDVEVVRALRAAPLDTTALAVVRHAGAVPRSRWDGSDLARPLHARGRRQAEALAGPLAALGVERAVTSDAVRCVSTLRPWSESHRVTLDLQPAISEEGFASAGPDAAEKVVRDVMDDSGPAGVICSHRPVLPTLLAAGGIAPGKALRPGAFVVVHHHQGEVVATERHEV